MDVFFSDIDNYSTSSSEDQEDDEFMYGSILSNLEETMGKIDDFFSFERKYGLEDIVYSIHDPSGQTGKVINLEMVVELESVHGKKLIKDINSKKLETSRSISVGDYVVSGSWVGKAEKIVDRVTVLFDDSTKSEFLDDENLVPISPDSFDGYFPGQRVKIERTNWFCGTQRYEDEGTVLAVDTGFVYVNWVGCVSGQSEGRTPPESFQNSRDLISISGFTHSNWQLGDRCLLPGFQEIFVISKIKSKLDVLWQDGTESRGLASVLVGPVNVVDPHDFFPHQFVVEKSSDDREIKNWGVVKIVDANEKTAKVKWEGNGIEETVSAYELIEHPEFSFCHGDVVFGLEDTCPVGIVMGLKDGMVEVKWATGVISKVGPHEIYRMDKSEGVSATSLLHNGNTESNQEKSEHAINLKAKVLDVDVKPSLWSLFDSTTFNVSRAVVAYLCNFSTRLLGSPAYTSLSPTSNSLSEGQRGPKSGLESQEESGVSIETTENKSKDVPFVSSSKSFEEFEKFAVVTDCSNHHFVDNGDNSISNQVRRSWLKKVQQEWNILMKDLPEMIYVRVFEERMDLLRAAIIGAPGTPYEDGLFFFDLFLPPDYPHEPPMVHYVSGGLRVNPNLYESGRVCLSLLNTWTGTGTETWNPHESTILQVLLSLQALVLNKDPYFNEAGYDQQVGSVQGEKNSCSYNENTFLVSCKSMIYTLRNPPTHFEPLVEEHFRKRYTCILMACKAYMEGVPIGCAFEGEQVGQTKTSTGFQITLSKLFPKIVEAFSAKGFDCSKFAENVKKVDQASNVTMK